MRQEIVFTITNLRYKRVRFNQASLEFVLLRVKPLTNKFWIKYEFNVVTFHSL